MEGAALIVYALQNRRIHPNAATLFYAFIGMVGGLLLSLPYKSFVWVALLIFYFKGVLDSADGHLARMHKKTSVFGEKLDAIAGFLGTLSFYVGIGFYFANFCQTYDLSKLGMVIWVLGICFMGKIYKFQMGRCTRVDTIIFLVGVHQLALDFSQII